MRRIATLAAAAILAGPHLAAAAEAPCLSAAEFTALSSYALPSVITGTSQRCAAVLPEDAFLRRKGGELTTRYASQKPAAWPGAKAAFLKMSASGKDDASSLIRSLPDSSLQPMLDAFIEGVVSQRLPAAQCSTIDRVVRLLSPLPPENTAELIALAAGLGSRSGGGKLGAVALCRAS